MKSFTLKLVSIALLCLGFSVQAFAQNVGIGTNTPAASAKLDIEDTNRGLLIPRVSLVNVTDGVNPVNTPATGLLVWNINAAVTGGGGAGFYYWDGTQWVMLGAAGASGVEWQLLGNAGTNPTTNFLGTTDAQDLVFRTNNVENVRVNINGNVGIGTTSNIARLYTRVPNTDNITNYGIYNYFDGIDAGTVYGIRNLNYGSSNGNKYGLYNYVNSEGTGNHYGIMNYTYMNSASNATGWGSYNYLSAYGTGQHRANYNYLNLQGAAVSTQNTASYNLMNVASSTNTSTIYGEYTDVDFSAGTSYGEYKEMNSNSGYTSEMYGDYNLMQGTGNGIATAVYNSMAGTGSGTKYGVRNQFVNSTGTKTGVYNYIESGTANSLIYGVYNYSLNSGTSTQYGVRNYINGGRGSLRGSYNQIYPNAANANTIYGVYSYISSAGTGNHYGVYSNVPGGTNDYAAVFAAGNFVANEVGGNYDFRIESDTRQYAMWVDASQDVVFFGSNLGTATDNGATVAGSTVQYVADFDLGGAVWDGTAIGIGSIEYMLDGVAETTINNDFSPTTHINRDLGFSTTARGWDDVYADNFVNISDAREKNDIQNITYGLDEVMQMRPVSYILKKDPWQERKLGLIAQEALPLVPEAVKTHDYKVTDETKPNESQKIEMKRMGMTYNTLVPVLIKAMQEQQAQIEELKKEVEQLKSGK